MYGRSKLGQLPPKLDLSNSATPPLAAAKSQFKPFRLAAASRAALAAPQQGSSALKAPQPVG
jgi:hypothetical protein